jgi:hypothetical protein
LYSSYIDFNSYHVLVSSLMDNGRSALTAGIRIIISGREYADALVSPGADTDIAPVAMQILMIIRW